jgi:hypothetical protein
MLLLCARKKFVQDQIDQHGDGVPTHSKDREKR